MFPFVHYTIQLETIKTYAIIILQRVQVIITTVRFLIETTLLFKPILVIVDVVVASIFSKCAFQAHPYI